MFSQVFEFLDNKEAYIKVALKINGRWYGMTATTAKYDELSSANTQFRLFRKVATAQSYELHKHKKPSLRNTTLKANRPLYLVEAEKKERVETLTLTLFSSYNIPSD